MACLATGVWGGLVRLYWSFVPLTSYNVNWVTFHGPLMVSGFLGTLIGVERAAALSRWWAYPAPLLTATGGLALAMGFLGRPAPVLISLGSLWLLLITAWLLLQHRAAFLAIMAAGCAAWLVGNLLWLSGWPIHRVVPWWIGFLLLTIVAERVELSRLLQPTRLQRVSLLLAVTVFAAGLMLGAFQQAWGDRISGAAIVAVAGWLLRCDIARRTVRTPGPPRFTALCLLSGYVWLAVAGLSLAVHAPLPKFGPAYDVTLHAFFLGFVFAMIFGHAPIIFPAVLGVPVPFHKWFYVHLGALHISLLVRVVGDIANWNWLHGWGGLLNAAALVLFVITTVAAVVAAVLKGTTTNVAGRQGPL